MTDFEAARVVRMAALARMLVLVVSSCVCLIMFAAYSGGLPPADSPGLRLINSIIGIEFWAWCFGLAGLFGLIAAGAGSRSRWIVVIQGVLCGFWGMAHMIAWVVEGGRGYVSAAPWVLCELLVLVLLLLPARRRG